MPINIRNAEVERLLGELKAETGRGTTEIVLELARREVERRRRLRTIDERRHRMDEIAARYQARLPERRQTPDEIIGYDDDGLPA